MQSTKAGNTKTCLNVLSRYKLVIVLFSGAVLLFNIAYMHYSSNVKFNEMYNDVDREAWQYLQQVRSEYYVYALVAQGLAAAVLVYVIFEKRK